ncbi:MAG: hypothetical protein AAFZ15_22885 [Bacteroidota bacterium]
MTNFNSNLTILFKALFKSIGAVAAVLLLINLAAYFSGLITTGFYEESSSLFKQSAFSIEGRSLADQLNGQSIIGLFVLAFIAVLVHEIKQRRVVTSAVQTDSSTPVKELNHEQVTYARMSERAA